MVRGSKLVGRQTLERSMIMSSGIVGLRRYDIIPARVC